MSLVWNELRFPAAIDAESVAAILATLGAEGRGRPSRPQLPVVLETVL